MNLSLRVFLVICLSLTGLQAEKPNILFIFADDWGWGDLSCHGHPYVKTPNIDRLAKEGTDFHRFTVASGVCSPSRAAVMTGHFPARYSINGHFAWVPNNAKRGMPDWLDPASPLMSRFLQSAGYRTAHFGKWHLSNNMIPDSPLPEVYGYDRAWAFNCSGIQLPVHEDANETIAFIEKSHEEKQPFFVNLWVHEPHTPFHTVPKYRWEFRDLDEADTVYASVLAHADDRIGKILDKLDQLGIADNTLVIFSSDNGPARRPKPDEPPALIYDSATGPGFGLGGAMGITAGRKGHKAALYEGGINVPFIARWPGKIAAGKVDDTTLISAVDLLPTFCELAEATLPDDYKPDGISQVTALKGTPTANRETPLFWKMGARPRSEKNPYHWVSYACVVDSWKILTNKDQSYSELYNIVEDPLEKTNLQESNPEIVAQLLTRIADWQKTLPEGPFGNVFSAAREQLK